MSLWLPGVDVVTAANDGGSMTGGPPRFIWHTYEADPNKLSAHKGALALRAAGNDLHFVFNPITGDITQMMPANRAGRGLVNQSGGVQTNRMGQYCIQMEVIAFAKNPFTDYITPAGMATVVKLMAWVRSLGIPDVFPSGDPPAYPSGSDERSSSIWVSKAGHYGHSQVPENVHGDPGKINTKKLLGVVAPPPPPPGKFVLKRYLYVKNPLISGGDVKECQKVIGMNVADRDGIYGSQTESHVKGWQRTHKLTADGVVGPATAKSFGWVWQG